MPIGLAFAWVVHFGAGVGAWGGIGAVVASMWDSRPRPPPPPSLPRDLGQTKPPFGPQSQSALSFRDTQGAHVPVSKAGAAGPRTCPVFARDVPTKILFILRYYAASRSNGFGHVSSFVQT